MFIKRHFEWQRRQIKLLQMMLCEVINKFSQ